MSPAPSDDSDIPAPMKETESNRSLWGIWNISFDPASLEVVIEPIRNPQVHFDVTNLLLPPACDNCIEIKVNSFDPVEHILDVDVTLRNPTQLTGYDIRGILYTNDAGHELTNPDAWTELWDIPGGLDRNPFMAYAKTVGQHAFAPGAEHTENYIIQFPSPPQWLSITFAIDASWPGNCKEPYRIYLNHDIVKLDEEGVMEGIVSAIVRDWQFDTEWVKLDCSALGAVEKIDLYQSISQWHITITNEWFALEGNYYCWLEAKSQSDPEILYNRFTIRINENSQTTPVWDDTVGITGAYLGDEQVMVTYGTATDPQGFDVQYNVYYIDIEDGNNPFDDPGHVKLSDVGLSPYTVEGLINGHTYWFGVRASDPFGHEDNNEHIEMATPHDDSGWVRHIGGEGDYNVGYGAAIDSMGNVYSTGVFRKTVDFDPGPGVDEHTAGNYDAFLWKLDSAGNFLWAKTWGGDNSSCFGMQAALDESGNLYVIGAFIGLVDFDPGPTVDEQEVEGGWWHTSLSKFDANGNYQWTRVWDTQMYVAVSALLGIAIDGSSCIYLSGYFEGTMDFDPGPGTSEYTSNGGVDAYLSKFDADGNFVWARTWGGSYNGTYDYYDYYESGAGVVIDSSGYVYVTGIFGDTVDFDPGPDIEEHTADGTTDAFLSKFDSNGNFQWAQNWANTGWGIAIDDQDYIFISGMDDDGAYIEKFNANGESQWSSHWGAATSYDVALDGTGNIFVTGYYEDTVDFDPGPDILEFTSEGSYDVFLSSLDSDGALRWTRVWGDSGLDWAADVAVTDAGDSYVPGTFQYKVDFFFGPGIDERESLGSLDIFLVKYPPDGNW